MFKLKRRRFRWLTLERIDRMTDIIQTISGASLRIMVTKGLLMAIIGGLSTINPEKLEVIVDEAVKVVSLH